MLFLIVSLLSLMLAKVEHRVDNTGAPLGMGLKRRVTAVILHVCLSMVLSIH